MELPPTDLKPDKRIRRSSTKRDARRKAIAEAAVAELNEHGFGGLKLASVAAKLGMSKENLTYYFRKRDDLAAYCFDQAIDAYKEMAARAAQAASPAERVARFVELYLARASAALDGTSPPLAILSDIRALDEPLQSRALANFNELLFGTARLVAPNATGEHALYRFIPQTHILLVQLFWSAAWLPDFALSDHERLGRRLTDILCHGLIPSETYWLEQQACDARAIGSSVPKQLERASFFSTAIRQINLYGYRGASIDRIATAIGATKGAIYHHHESKDELVEACFVRSLGMFWSVIRHAETATHNPGDRLQFIVNAILALQTSPHGPLLRDTALAALPPELRTRVMAQWKQIILNLTGLLADGTADGHIRRIDPYLAAHALIAGANATEEVFRFLPDEHKSKAVDLCARPLLLGALSL